VVPSAGNPYTYTAPADSRDKAFILREGVAVWGGYPANPSNATTDADRSSAANITTLSGDIDNNNALDTGNAYHVALAVNIGASAVLDGLIITGGYADGSGSLTVGGQLISQGMGGGVYVDRGSVTMSGNTASTYGGGVRVYLGTFTKTGASRINGDTDARKTPPLPGTATRCT
jgi:hypothetical protein